MRTSLVGALVGVVIAAPLAGVAVPSAASAAVTTEGFNTVVPAGWTVTNNSAPVGGTSVFQGTPTPSGPFDAQAGAANSYAGMNFNSTGSNGTISTWLVTPLYTSLSNDDVVSFYTRKIAGGEDHPDRLEVRMSTNGSCSPGTGPASVGDFTTLLESINADLDTGVYPQEWSEYADQLSGIAGTKTGCFAFRYFVTDGGSAGANSDYIGIDTYAYDDQPTDVTAPNTTLTQSPNPLINVASATFGFTSTESGTFECKLDAAAYAACTSPRTVNGLTDGSHTFSVRATDRAGNVDASPASSTFTVDTTAPDTTIGSGPAPGTTTNDTTPTFTFTSTEAGSTFACRVLPDSYAPCASPFTTAPLSDGVHTFEVRATDTAGNTDASVATATFTVDTKVVAPSVPPADCSPQVSAVAKAKSGVAKAKAQLKKAKKSGSAAKVKKAKAKVKKANQALKVANAALATCQAG